MIKKLIYMVIALSTIAISYFIFHVTKNQLPVVAIANYGPHSSLHDTIYGFKEQMRLEGFVENETIQYAIADVGFDPALIPQMLVSLKAKNPELMVVMTTPVAQTAKSKIKDIPLIYSVITDPLEAGLLKEETKANGNMVGSSDKQNLEALIKFVKSLLPKAQSIGLLYATSESNDIALVNMMQKAASAFSMNVVTIPIEQARDVPIRVQEFKDKVDIIYVGSSGPIQPTLPAISAAARKMHIPVFNMDSQAVKDELALASFGVDYKHVGKNTAKLAAAILRGERVDNLKPTYPTIEDHYGIINKKLALEFGVKIPSGVKVVE